MINDYLLLLADSEKQRNCYWHKQILSGKFHVVLIPKLDKTRDKQVTCAFPVFSWACWHV